MLPTGQCTFSRSEKNIQFDHKYNLKHEEKIKIIKSIEVSDCVDIQPNSNLRYPDTDVFIFHKSVDIDVYGETTQVTLYIKEYVIDQDNMEMAIVISFHEEGLYGL